MVGLIPTRSTTKGLPLASNALKGQMAHGVKIQTSPNNDAATHKMVNMMEDFKNVERYKKNIEKLMKGTLDVPGFLQAVSPQLLVNLLVTAETTENEKVKTNIHQDLLDRAGHGKITKGAVLHAGVIDADTTKRELVNLAKSMSKKAGFKVKDESHVEGDVDVIDVTPDK